ncbi:MAG: P-II family nitrogen regulator [Clostridiales bacterium]|nr:P-II family nitrogen regulator [Clostridiales bacterium]
MELNFVLTIVDRERAQTMETICQNLKLPLALTMLCQGTATSEHLSLYGLAQKEKALISTVADRDQTRKLMRAAKLRLFIDIPGNGIMMSVPIKSVGGGRTMAYLTDNKTPTGEKPSMVFSHELIYVILNEGASDQVMHAARSAGATGGTVLLGKGTGSRETGKFLGISLASEKDVVLIVAEAGKKAAIMKAIVEQAGPGTDAGAICFSLPVSQVAGLRQVEANDEDDIAEENAAEEA